jgi:hypothetical protein
LSGELEEVSRAAVAAPFLLAAALLLLLQPFGRFIADKFDADLQAVFLQANVSSNGELEKYLPAEMYPANVRQRFEHLADVLAGGTAIVAPAGAVAGLNIAGLADQAATLIVLVLAASYALVFTMLRARPGRYASWARPRGKRWALSPVTWIGVLLNLVAAGVAVLLTGPVYALMDS